MARINGSGFKMKRTPVKGNLGDFFSSLGKQLKRNRKDIGGEFKGVKQKDKARILENRADAAYYGSAEDKAKNSEADRIKPTVVEEPKVVKKPNSKITGAIGSKTRKDQYDAKGWKYDDTIKGYNRDGTKKRKFKVQIMVGKQNVSADVLKKMNFGKVNKTQQGTEMYTYHSPDFKTQEEADTYLAKAKLSGFENAFIPSPIDKKSPTKKKGFKMPGYGKRK